jgi:hypothetical protein
MATVADDDFEGSAWEIAVTVTLAGLGIEEGPTYKPVVAIVPNEELPPVTVFTCHVIAVLELPVTVALKSCVALVTRVADVGEIETLTCAVAVPGVMSTRKNNARHGGAHHGRWSFGCALTIVKALFMSIPPERFKSPEILWAARFFAGLKYWHCFVLKRC